ncbi:restriction endonuclease subunit S [Shinella oryzae]|uniref:restriction endonuclease subunit S n=1 Tax=Shinella oryzae TaxID=2871820 RepID=UPI001FF61356|nr:restriction endonuclease subunit S [Shinella oryzae]UPA24484.1 restriction endonuclease subunit S [Shinella oryzae]
MNTERLLQHYEQIADAPNAIARLRQFILDLAVRGKLVPQNPTDELASELLKKIESGRRQAGIKQASDTGGGVRPFDLPKGWAWSTIGSICSKTGSGSTPRGGKEVYVDRGIPFLRSQNVYDEGLRLSDVAYIAREVHARMAGTAVKPLDLLLNITGGSMGRCSLVPESFGEANISQHVAIIRPVFTDMSGFMHGLVLSPYFQAFIFDEQTGAGRGGLPKNRMDQIAVALPPLAEQHRIVAKVDELMALCDELEAARKERETKRDRLVTASLARFNTPNPETFRNAARFALDAMPALTARPDQIKQLRQAILNLAARGKLVPQDPTDEPAVKYLAAFSDLAKARKLLKPLTMDDCALVLPETWSWLPLGAMIGSMDAGWSPQCENHPRKSEEEWAVLKTTAVQALSFDADQNKLLPSKLVPRPQFEAQIGDILVTRAGPKNRVGVSCVVDVPCQRLMISDKLIRFHPIGKLSARYLALTLNAGHSFKRLEDAKSGMAVMQMNISQDKLRAIPIPLPPLAEQHRIVAKVDELMALCDELETSLISADEARKKLLDALLAEALAPVEIEVMQEAAE